MRDKTIRLVRSSESVVMHHHRIEANGIGLHVAEQGRGPVVLFCHGFPSLWSLWRRQMQAVAEAGYRGLAPDMRGYGDSDAPEAATAYTPFHTVGDLVGLLDHFGVEQAVVVGHDFGAHIAWSAALMRPDRFPAVFAVSVPYRPPSRTGLLASLRDAGVTDFYMFRQVAPDAEQAWADAATTIPGMMYWTSGHAPEGRRWDPFDSTKGLIRAAPEPLSWIDADDLQTWISTFENTGFHGPLNYYRAIDINSEVASGAFAGAKIRQPAFFLTGGADGLNAATQPNEQALREMVPDLRGFVTIDGVGHWPQLEAVGAFNRYLTDFLGTVSEDGHL